MLSRFPGPKRQEPRSRSHGRAGGWRAALQSGHFRPGLCLGHSAQWESVKITRHFGSFFFLQMHRNDVECPSATSREMK